MNNLDPDQAQQNVGPGLDPNCLTLLLYSRKNVLKKLILKKATNKKNHEIFPGMQGFNSDPISITFTFYEKILYINI